ncbi:MAG: hypothetical protein PHP79_08975 [Clostridia bacterium]|nr:hypothetical protein [Clostridia bacterium]
MAYSIIEYLWLFIIYAFLGWCVEVAYHVVTSGRFVNRGFLNGPVCPIYGFGMIMLLSFLGSLVENFILLFLGSFLLTSILEFITGFTLEKVFNDKWWDYTFEPFNIKGYVCLSFSIKWGLGAVFMIKIIHPPIDKFVSVLNNGIGYILLVLLLSYCIIDFIITVLGILKIKRHIRLLDEIRDNLRLYSDDIGENIYKGMTVAIKTRDSLKHKLEDSKFEFESALYERKLHIAEQKAKYDKLLKEKGFVHKRLEKAFPHIREKISNLDYHRKNK